VSILFKIVPLYKRSRQLSQYSDSLRAAWSRDRIPVGVRFSGSIQTGPEANPASYTRDTRCLWGRWPPTQSSAGVKERVELHFYSPSGPSWPVVGWTVPYFTFTFTSPHWQILQLSLSINKIENYCRPRCNTDGSDSPLHHHLVSCISSVYSKQATLHHIRDYGNLQGHRHDNLKYH
jgi:hypothetical protein